MDISKFYQEDWSSRKNQSSSSDIRYCALKSFFPPTTQNLQVLDLAAGNGAIALLLKKNGYQVTAIELSKEGVKQLKSKGIQNSRVGNVEDKLPLPSSHFDIVFWGDNIEHLLMPELVLKQIKRVLKKGGQLIITTPNISFILYRWHYFKTGHLPITEGIFSEPWQWKHIRFFNSQILVRLLTSHGFKIVNKIAVTPSKHYNFLARFLPDLFGAILIMEAVKTGSGSKKRL